MILPETAAETALILFDEIIRHFLMHRDPHWPKTTGLSVGLAARPAHAHTFADLQRAAARVAAIPVLSDDVDGAGHLQINQEMVIAQEPDIVFGLRGVLQVALQGGTRTGRLSLTTAVWCSAPSA